MRKPAEVLELALSLLDENKVDNHYMCVHLDWLEQGGHITMEEKHATRSIVVAAISPWSSLSGHLRSVGVMKDREMSDSPGFREHQVTFYTNLIATLKQE